MRMVDLQGLGEEKSGAIVALKRGRELQN